MSNINIALSYTDATGNLDAATLAAVKALILGVPQTPGVTAITIAPATLSLTEGGASQLVATAVGATSPPTFLWATDTPGVATVDQSGNVTAIAAGTANITASTGAVVGTCPVTVAADNAVATIQVSPTAFSLVAAAGQNTGVLAASAFNAEGRLLSGVSFSWTSSNTADATVTPTGQTATVTALAPGSVTITLSASGVSTTANCSVTVATSATGQSLTSDKTSFVVAVGDTTTLALRTRNVALDTISSPPAVSWASSNTGVATVNSTTGVVTGVAAGAVTITGSSPAGSVAIPGVVLTSTYLLRDRWVKANSTTSAGTAETGQTWTATSPSVAGILSEALYFPTEANDAPVLADSTVSDGLFLFRLRAPAFGAAFYIRWTDSNNYVKCYAQAGGGSGQVVLKGKNAGANLPSYFFNCRIDPDDVLILRASGAKLQVQVNADIIGSINDTSYGAQAGHMVGMGFQSGTGASFGRFGEVAVRALDHAPSTTESSIALSCTTASITADGTLSPSVYQFLSTGENMSLGRNTSNSAPLAAAITWATSDPTVATVSTQGVVRGVAPGSCNITASDGSTATLALTVGQAAGFTASLAYTHEPAGFTMRTDRPFSSFQPGKAVPGGPTISGSLVTSGSTAPGTTILLTATSITGTLGAGRQFTISGVTYTAVADAVASSNILTVSVTPSVGSTITAGTAVTGYTDAATWNAPTDVATTHMTLQGDASSPKSPGNPAVLQLEYPGGTNVAAGSTYTAGTLELDFVSSSDTAAYICRWTKLTSGAIAFQGHPSGANKMGEFFLNNGATGLAHALQGAYCKSTTDPVNPRLCMNGGTDYRLSTYLPTNLVRDAQQIRGNWHKIEWAFQVNTIAADGTPNFDGEFHLWLDDLKVLEYRTLKFADTAAHITQWKPSWLFGGTGGSITNDYFVLEDHEHVSSGTSLGIP